MHNPYFYFSIASACSGLSWVSTLFNVGLMVGAIRGSADDVKYRESTGSVWKPLVPCWDGKVVFWYVACLCLANSATLPPSSPNFFFNPPSDYPSSLPALHSSMVHQRILSRWGDSRGSSSQPQASGEASPTLCLLWRKTPTILIQEVAMVEQAFTLLPSLCPCTTLPIPHNSNSQALSINQSSSPLFPSPFLRKPSRVSRWPSPWTRCTEMDRVETKRRKKRMKDMMVRPIGKWRTSLEGIRWSWNLRMTRKLWKGARWTSWTCNSKHVVEKASSRMRTKLS